ncbi:MAG: 50S ribosomal protein L21e [Thermoplasmata archaeon]
MKRSKGTRQGTRKIFRKKPRERGQIPVNRALQDFDEGEQVKIMIEPSVHKGQPHRRFHGKTGHVECKRGQAYIVNVKVGGKEKQVIARSEHLRRMD